MCLGIPGQLVERFTRDEMPMGKVDFGGVRKEICLAYTPEAEVGQFVLVHVGFALSVIDAQEAEQMRTLVEEIEAAAERESDDSPPAASAPHSPPPTAAPHDG